MKKYHIYLSLLLLALTFCVVSAQKEPTTTQNRLFSNALLKVGDWVFRKGIQADSLIVRKFDDTDFSHLGVVIFVSPEIKILHATTNDDPKKPDQVIVSSLAEFIDPKITESYAVARPNFLTEQQKQLIVNDLISMLGKPFRLVSKEYRPRYCTTIIAEAIGKYEQGFKLDWKQINIPLFDGYYLFPSEFAKRTDITWIYS